MDLIIIRIALEELSFVGSSGTSIHELFSRLTSRIRDGPYGNYIYLLKSPLIKGKVITSLVKHPGVILKDKECGSTCSIESFQMDQNFENFLLFSSCCLQKHILDLNIYSNISEVEGRNAVYMTISSKGFDGCWQYEISRKLKMDPKMVFQHLKYLYKYDNIVRFSIPMPTSHKKKLFFTEDSNSTSGGHLSAIIWLTRFFDFNRIPRELSRLIWYQYVQPLTTEILRILEFKAPGKIAWEKDIRSLCAGFLIIHDENSSDHLICSQRTANKVFNKLRDTLLTRNVRRVFAWNPATKSYSPCLCLNDAFPFTTMDFQTNNIQVKTEVNVRELNILPEIKNSINEEAGNINLNESLLSGLNSEEANNYSSGKSLFEITEAEQVLWLIRASGKSGIVSLDLVDIIGINMKRVGKLLSDLHKINMIVKVPHRYNRTFMYRYYFNEIELLDSKLNIDTPENSVNKNTLEKNNFKSETESALSLFGESVTNGNIDFPGVTEQFARRLILTKGWIDDSKILTIPEISKLLSEHENTQKGPDRKTIRRIISKIFEFDQNIKETLIISDKNRTKPSNGDITIFFSSRFYSEEEARNLKAIELKNKRSSTTKSAIERRKRELSQVAAIIDASNTSPNKLKENKKKPSNCHMDVSLLSEDERKDKCDELHSLNTPRLISNEIGDAAVMINTPDFTVASLNIEIERQKSSTELNLSNKAHKISNLHIPGALHANSIINFDPSKRMNLGFSNNSRGGIKVQSSDRNVGFISFSQKILAHYGFVFPIMIRLKILHKHIIQLFGEFESENKLLSTKEILDEMIIDTFLRVIGFGHRSTFIEEYLMYGDSQLFSYGPETKIKELPSNIYETLTRNFSKTFSGNITQDQLRSTIEPKGRKATTVLYKLLFFLCKLGFIRFLSPNNSEDNNKDPNDKYSKFIETISTSSLIWKLELKLNIPILIDSTKIVIEKLTDYIKHNSQVFNLMNTEEFEHFWEILNNESVETNNFIVQEKLVNYSPIFPDILSKRNWKINPLLPLNKRNTLEKYARKLLFNNDFSNEENKTDESHTVLSLASPEIKNISVELSLPPLTTLRYLLRVVDSISLDTDVISNGQINKKISFHPLRDPRYQCHICHALYSTHPAIISHYKIIHEISMIANSSMYTLKKNVSFNSRNKNNINASIKTQILTDNLIPPALKHLVDVNETGNLNEIDRDDKIALLRAFLRLCKDDIILLYCILFISEKSSYSLNQKIKPNENLFKIFSFCKDKSTENGLFSVQFLRIKSLIEMNKISKNRSINFLEFIFSCLETIYPLNSKLIETIKQKEKQRICWYGNLEVSAFFNTWGKLGSFRSGFFEYVRNPLLNYSHETFNLKEKIEQNIKNNNPDKLRSIEYFILVNLIKSELLSPKSLDEDSSIDQFNILSNETRIREFFKDSIEKNIIRYSNRSNETGNFQEVVFSKKYSISRRTLISCFGKTVVWREIFDLCLAYLQVNCSGNKLFRVNQKNLNGALVLSHLNNLVSEENILEVEWNDQDFYEKASSKTDKDLFRLLNEAVNSNSEIETNILESLELSKNEETKNLNRNKKTRPFMENGLSGELDYIETINEPIEKPVVSSITASYNSKYSNHFFTSDDFVDFPINIPFLGSLDSDPLEIHKVPLDFSVSGFFLKCSEQNKKLRKINDPILEVIKELSHIIINQNSENEKIIIRLICCIIYSLDSKSNHFFSMKEIEEIFFSEFPELIPKILDIKLKTIDPGILVYNLRIPILYHIMFIMEIFRICYRIPVNGIWVYLLYNATNFRNFLGNEDKFIMKEEDIFDKCGEISLPLNIPARMWLLWSKEAVIRLFNKDEINTFYTKINLFLEINKPETVHLLIPMNLFNCEVPRNSFLSNNGKINKSICSLLVYYISYSIYKSPVVQLDEFTSRFTFFDNCEIELIMESMFGEGCLYKDYTKVIISKPVEYIFKVYEGYY
ncbi:b-block-binding subunit of tfiiic protein [Cryptosporidium felis]|nr:b-block-binding subunit of tfiiic protein [Cryptosporidium felis]